MVCLCNCRWRFGSAVLLSAGVGTAHGVVRDEVVRSPTMVVAESAVGRGNAGSCWSEMSAAVVVGGVRPAGMGLERVGRGWRAAALIWVTKL